MYQVAQDGLKLTLFLPHPPESEEPATMASLPFFPTF